MALDVTIWSQSDTLWPTPPLSMQTSPGIRSYFGHHAEEVVDPLELPTSSPSRYGTAHPMIRVCTFDLTGMFARPLRLFVVTMPGTWAMVGSR